MTIGQLLLMEVDTKFNPIVPRLACDDEKRSMIRENNHVNDNELQHTMCHNIR